MQEQLQSRIIYIAYALLISVVVYFIVAILHVSGYYENRAVKKEVNLVAKHYEEIKNIYQMIRGWRHDYKNHIQVMSALLELGNIEQLGIYLNELSNELDSLYTFVKTGNVVVDAVLSSKLSACKMKNIPCETVLSLPKNCRIKDIDLCIIISNLLDNAIEACEKIDNTGNRFIRVSIENLKGQLYINVTNAVNEPPEKRGNKFVSSKGENHGFGLGQIDRTVRKYVGFVNRYFEDDRFVTEIMIPFV